MRVIRGFKVMNIAAALVFVVSAVGADDLLIDWFTIDGGGGVSVGGDFELSGTIGQPDASATMSGGDYELAGGFWPGLVATSDTLPGDLNCDGVVNFGDIDPFVLALTDAAAYATIFPECDILNADINGDGSVNFGDIDPFVALLTGE